MNLFKSLSTNQRSEKIKGSSVISYGTTNIQRGEPSDKLEKSFYLLSSHVFQCVKAKQSLIHWGFLFELSCGHDRAFRDSKLDFLEEGRARHGREQKHLSRDRAICPATLGQDFSKCVPWNTLL